jgi:uncharacterized membrane protein YjjP (DUF1212 family)
MSAVVAEIYSITLHDLYQQAEHSLLQLHQLMKKMVAIAKRAQVMIPFSAIASVLFVGCLMVYVLHSQTYAFPILAVAGCILSALSLFIEKGGFHKVQAISCLAGNANLILFFNYLNSPF